MKKWHGAPVRAMRVDFGTLPSNAERSVPLPLDGNLIVDVCRLEGYAKRSDNAIINPLPFISDDGSPLVKVFVFNRNELYVKTFADLSNYTASFYIEYTV